MKKRKFLSDKMQNVMKISGGTITGQLISIVTLPFITRIYGAEIMGIWTTILSVALIVQSVSELGLTNSIMIEEDETKLVKLYSVVTSICLAISILSTAVFFPYFHFIKGYPILRSLIYSCFGVVYAFTVKQVNTCYTWLNRYKRYDILMKNPIINYSVIAVISLGFGLIGFKDYGYFIGVIMGQIVTLLHMKSKLPKMCFHLKKSDYTWTFKKYHDFVKYQTPNSFTVQIRDQFPNLLIGSLFGNTMLGYYSVSVRILNMPVTFLGQAIGKVFYQTASELKRNKQDVGPFVYRNFKRAIYLATIPMFCLFVGGDIAAVIFLGSDYVIAGTMLRIVVFKSFFAFISTSTQGLEIVLRKQQYAVITSVSQTIAACLGVAIGFALSENVYLSLILMSLFYIFVQICYYRKMYAVMNIKIGKQIILMAGIFAGVIISGQLIRSLMALFITHFDIGFLSWFSA